LIELYDGKLQVHIWDGSFQDAQSTVIQPANTYLREQSISVWCS